MNLTKRIARWYRLRRLRKKADAMSHEDFLNFITTVDSEIVLAYMGTIDRTKSVLHDFSRSARGHSIASQLRYGVGWQVMGFSRKRIAKNDARTKAMVDFTIAVAEGKAKVIQNITLAPDSEQKQ